MIDNVRKEEASRRAALSNTTKRSYAEVVTSPIKRTNHSSRDGNHFVGNGRSWSTLSLDISEDDKLRYKNVWVGRLKKLEITLSLRIICRLVVLFWVKVTFGFLFILILFSPSPSSSSFFSLLSNKGK